MGDAQDYDILTHYPVHDNVSPDGKTPGSGAQIIVSGATDARPSGQQIKPIVMASICWSAADDVLMRIALRRGGVAHRGDQPRPIA